MTSDSKPTLDQQAKDSTPQNRQYAIKSSKSPSTQPPYLSSPSTQPPYPSSPATQPPYPSSPAAPSDTDDPDPLTTPLHPPFEEFLWIHSNKYTAERIAAYAVELPLWNPQLKKKNRMPAASVEHIECFEEFLASKYALHNARLDAEVINSVNLHLMNLDKTADTRVTANYKSHLGHFLTFIMHMEGTEHVTQYTAGSIFSSLSRLRSFEEFLCKRGCSASHVRTETTFLSDEEKATWTQSYRWLNATSVRLANTIKIERNAIFSLENCKKMGQWLDPDQLKFMHENIMMIMTHLMEQFKMNKWRTTHMDVWNAGMITLFHYAALGNRFEWVMTICEQNIEYKTIDGKMLITITPSSAEKRPRSDDVPIIGHLAKLLQYHMRVVRGWQRRMFNKKRVAQPWPASIWISNRMTAASEDYVADSFQRMMTLLFPYHHVTSRNMSLPFGPLKDLSPEGITVNERDTIWAMLQGHTKKIMRDIYNRVRPIQQSILVMEHMQEAILVQEDADIIELSAQLDKLLAEGLSQAATLDVEPEDISFPENSVDEYNSMSKIERRVQIIKARNDIRANVHREFHLSKKKEHPWTQVRYMMRHKYPNDEFLQKYIHDHLDTVCCKVTCNGQTFWEIKFCSRGFVNKVIVTYETLRDNMRPERIPELQRADISTREKRGLYLPDGQVREWWNMKPYNWENIRARLAGKFKTLSQLAKEEKAERMKSLEQLAYDEKVYGSIFYDSDDSDDE
ncbi:hypothetical protein PROFUN_16185 [Planoprotostelium fungivorum]|uniref:Uncharacterized protein n=1 Tax=Planoprotostelium fungivorum TaxID=1890364 RepID=A0A2P6MS85_9EUKA|nr:hypothetical protein PROFUN_16185 [Planoprotostelium fungivorum]